MVPQAIKPAASVVRKLLRWICQARQETPSVRGRRGRVLVTKRQNLLLNADPYTAFAACSHVRACQGSAALTLDWLPRYLGTPADKQFVHTAHSTPLLA
eukprot:3800828-Amphidinium_carterae.2